MFPSNFAPLRILVTLTSILALGSRSAHAACGATDVETEERLDYLAKVIDKEVNDVETWSGLSTGVLGLAAITQASLIPVMSDPGRQLDFGVGAAISTIGTTAYFLIPMRVTRPLRTLRREWSQAERCALLLKAEETIEKIAGEQELAKGLVPHVGNFFLNLTGALFLGLGYGRWTSAAIGGLTRFTVGEVVAFTRPHRLTSALERYRNGEFRPSKPKLSWFIEPEVAPNDGLGLRISMTW